MKDSQVYNVFLETLNSRKDIGGLLNPSTVSRVASASGLAMPLVQAELTKIADGVHPNTANGARVMMTLARMFPSRTSPGMPIAVAAGMDARLQGNFYDTLGQRALPSNLPNTTVRAYDPKGTGAPTSTTQGSRTASSGIVMPSGAIRPGMVMPNIQSIPSAAGGFEFLPTFGGDPIAAAALAVGLGGLLAGKVYKALKDEVSYEKNYRKHQKQIKEYQGSRRATCGDSGGTIASGRPCSNPVDNLGERCYLHKKQPMTDEQAIKLTLMKVNSMGRVVNPTQPKKPFMSFDRNTPNTGPFISRVKGQSGGTGTSATVKVDGMGNVLSNGIDDMVANTITGQPIAVSSKELLAIGPGGGIAGVTSPGDEARGKIVHPMGTSLMRGGKFQRLRGFAVKTQDFGVEGGSIGPATREQAEQVTQPVYQGPVAGGRMDKFAASIGFLTSGVYTLQTAFQQFTATTQDGADKFTKMAAATTLAITGIQGVSQMLVENGKVEAMQNKAAMMQGAGKGKMSMGMGKMLGVGSKALGMLGGPMGMIATSVAIAAVNKGIEMYQKAVKQAKDAGRAMFKDPIEGAKLLGITLKDTSAIAQTYAKIAEGLGMKGTGKGAYDKTYAEVVKKDYGDLISSMKLVLNQEEKRNKLLLTYINLKQKGFSDEDAKSYVQEIARQSGAMSAFNSINVDNLKTSTQIANQTVASTKALMQSIGTVDQNLIGKYINKKTGDIYNTFAEADAARQQDSSWMQRNAFATDAGLGDYEQIDKNTAGKLSAGILGGMSSLGLDEKQMGEAIAGALKTAYAIAATDPSAANQAGAMIISQLVSSTSTPEMKEAANSAILEMMKEAGASTADQGYNFVLGGGLTTMAADEEGKFAGLGDQYANAISVAIQSGNIDIVNDLIKNSDGAPDAAAMNAFVNKLAKIQALAKIDLEVDIQLEQTKKQLEEIKAQLGKTFDILIASKQAELELEDKRHAKALKNLDNEAKRLNDKKDVLQRNTDYYIKELQREKEAEDYYARQRQTGLSGLKAISQGDVFGLIGAQMEAASSSDQFGRDRSIQNIQSTADEAQKKLDEDLRNIDNRRAAEDARHESEIANINAEIEFLNKKRSVSVGAAEKAISKIEKVVAMSPSDPGYQAAVQEAMSLATTAGMQASQVLQNVDTSKFTKEELDAFTKVKDDLGLAVGTFTADTETALQVVGRDVEEITKNIADSLGASGDILKEVVTAMNQPVDPNSVIAKVAALAGIDVGTPMGGVDGQAGAGNAAPAPAPAPKTTNPGNNNQLPGQPPFPKNGDAGSWYQDSSGMYWRLQPNNVWDKLPMKGTPPKSFGNSVYKYGDWTSMASGGMLSGPGTGTSDSIPIMASHGEYVIRADAAKNIGKAKLDQLNRAGLNGFAMGGLVGSMPVMQSAPGFASGGSIPMPTISAPSTPKYNVPSAGGGMSPSPIAQMARGGQVNSSSSNVNSSPVMNFNGVGMDMVMHHVNKAVGGRMNSNSRRIG
jgi:hypothetical protein